MYKSLGWIFAQSTLNYSFSKIGREQGTLNQPGSSSEKLRSCAIHTCTWAGLSERYSERPSLTLYDLQIQNIIESIRAWARSGLFNLTRNWPNSNTSLQYLKLFSKTLWWSIWSNCDALLIIKSLKNHRNIGLEEMVMSPRAPESERLRHNMSWGGSMKQNTKFYPWSDV